MSLPATLIADQRRGNRRPLEADATLRDPDRTPHDVVIDEISATGCHIATLLELPLEAIVTIGIPEIGVHEALLVRETRGGYGCAFVRPLSADELASAMAAQSDRRVAFAKFPNHHNPGPKHHLTPPGMTGGAIIAGITLSWAIVILAAWLAFGK